MSLPFSSCKKRKSRSRQDRTLLVAETLAKWEERNVQLNSCMSEIKSVHKALAIGSKKGCMKGKGGPENSSCNYKGVRQRTWSKWVAKSEPMEKRLWIGTSENVVDAALSYDKAAMSSSCAHLNFSDYCSTAIPSSISLTATPTTSDCTKYSKDISMKFVTPNLRNEDGEDEAVTEAAIPSTTQQAKEANDERCNIEEESKCLWDEGQEYSMNEMWSLDEFDAHFERSPIRNIESVLDDDVDQLWFSTVESMNDMVRDTFISY